MTTQEQQEAELTTLRYENAEMRSQVQQDQEQIASLQDELRSRKHERDLAVEVLTEQIATLTAERDKLRKLVSDIMAHREY